MEAVDVPGDDEGGGECAGGDTGKLLGPKMSLRVAGTGEISPVDGVAENSEFCASDCPTAAEGAVATRASTSTGHSRPRTVAVVGAHSMTAVFSAQIAAISSHATACLWVR
jgi:hypothetical protein